MTFKVCPFGVTLRILKVFNLVYIGPLMNDSEYGWVWRTKKIMGFNFKDWGSCTQDPHVA